MNCPEYTGNGSSYGFNVEQSNCHIGTISTRMYFGDVNSPSDFIMMGCRYKDGTASWLLRKNSNRLASYHPKEKGNILCADGHVTISSQTDLMDTSGSPSLLNNLIKKSFPFQDTKKADCNIQSAFLILVSALIR